MNITSTHASKMHTRCQKSQYIQPEDTFNKGLQATFEAFFGSGEQSTDDVSLENAIAANHMRESHTEYYSDIDQETGEEIKVPVTVWSDTCEPINVADEPHTWISIDETEIMLQGTELKVIQTGQHYSVVNQYGAKVVTSFTKFRRFLSKQRIDQEFDATILTPIAERARRQNRS